MLKSTIDRSTTLCMSLAARPGLFGSRFHNCLYEELGLDYVYKAFTTTDLPAAIGGVRALGIRGCAISMPFKEAVIPLLDHMEASAAAIDSVNTIVNTNGELTGYNTDYSAVRALVEKYDANRDAPFYLRGSGGMAKAVAAALRDAGHHNGTIIARNAQAGGALARQYGYRWQAKTPTGPASILVNVTPIGMTGPHADELPYAEDLIASCDIAFDVVALPIETPFLRQAKSLGKSVIDGGQVAVLQALEQFILYTGVTPSAAQLDNAVAFARG